MCVTRAFSETQLFEVVSLPYLGSGKSVAELLWQEGKQDRTLKTSVKSQLPWN